MKNIKFVLFFFVGAMLFSCTNTNDIDPQSKLQIQGERPVQNTSSNQSASIREEEQIEIGYSQDGEFYFTVSNDQLSEVYAHNIELNLEENGELVTANVTPSDNEDIADYFLNLKGTVGDEGSAVLSADVSATEEPEGLIRFFINPVPVYPGLCFNRSCNSCDQVPIVGLGSCNCLNTPVPVFTCPYYIDPTFIWVF